MTEEEAKTKWCPFTRLGSECSGLGSLNRDHVKGVIPETRCLGSECMAWRWSTAKETEAFLGLVRERMKATGENFAKASQSALIENQETFVKTEGYCGLAGVPR